jgi:hypothetical protein
VKKLSLFFTAFKELYMSRVLFKKKIAQLLFHRQLTRPRALAFTWDLRFTPPLCDYSRSPSTWDLLFSSASQLGASTRKWGSWFRLGEVEPSFKEFLASPAIMRLGCCQLSLAWFVQIVPSLLFFKSYATLML